MLAHIHTREGERERPGTPCFFLRTQNFVITLQGLGGTIAEIYKLQ